MTSFGPTNHRFGRGVLALAVCAMTLAATPRVQAAGSFTTFAPGSPPSIDETVPVNIVLVGFGSSGPQGVDVARFKAGLPVAGAPVMRAAKLWYNLVEPLGIQWRYADRVLTATAEFESALWRELGTLAQPAPLTSYQAMYNAQHSRALDITDNAFIDARTVERWLAANAGPLLGLDTTQDTLFYINWFGQPGFRFHVYNASSRNPDTGFDTGTRDKAKLRAFGGSPDAGPNGAPARLWFYDLSAGPDWATISYALDELDPKGWAPGAYRMPTIWEYGNSRPAQSHLDVTEDLIRVTRFIVLDMLFTPSPIYSTTLPVTIQPRNIGVTLTVENLDWSGPVSNVQLMVDEWQTLEPWRTFTAQNIVDTTPGFSRVFNCFSSVVTPVPTDCYGHSFADTPWDDVLLYYLDHRTQLEPPGSDLQIPIIDVRAADGRTPGLGFTDDDWKSGKQSYILGMLTPTNYQQMGYGPTLLYEHEVGHYLGLSHPHDGYDPASAGEVNVSISEFGYAYLGDEVATPMSYMDLAVAFSQFDRDSVGRWSTASYLSEANRILPDIQASPRAADVQDRLRHADVDAASALSAFHARQFTLAATEMAQVYDEVIAAAKFVGVPIAPPAYRGQTQPRGSHNYNPLTAPNALNVHDDVSGSATCGC